MSLPPFPSFSGLKPSELHVYTIEECQNCKQKTKRDFKVVEAEVLLMLTDVEKVFLGFGKPGQRAIERMTVAECRKFLAQGQFPAGSMGPKIKNAIRFLESGGRRVTISPLDLAGEALAGRAGTTIVA
jgi:carbamate kinase